MNLDGKRILITGGSGFVGRWMAKEYPATLLDSDAYHHSHWHWEEWDVIIHLAPVDPALVIQCARNCGATILFASSGAAAKVFPNEYGLAKRRAELDLLATGLDVRIARMYTFAGGGMDWQYFALGQFLRDAHEGRPIRIMGSGKTIRSYLYAGDMARWMWAILERGTPRTYYDVGSDHPVTIQHLAAEIASNFIPAPEVVVENNMIGEDDYLPKAARWTREQLGVSQTVTFHEAIARTVKEYQDEHR